MSPALTQRAERARAWLFDDALPVWAGHGVNPRGGFFDTLDEHYRPGDLLRARVQARQTYVFAEAGRLGWGGPWRPLVEHGLAFLLHRAQRADGLVSCRFDLDGGALTGEADLYDQGFALFALAHAYTALGDERARAAAVRLREGLARYAHPAGGYREFGGDELKANPQMHLFEAAVAWTEAEPGDAGWRAMADNLARLCEDRLAAGGALHEHFGPGWTVQAGADGEITEPGHAYEWAWLLRRAGRPGPLPLALAEQAERQGVDPVRRVAVNQVTAAGVRLDGCARLWPQTERIKAALAFRAADEARWTAAAAQAFDGLFAYIEPAPRGLWRDVMEEDGSLRPQPAPASSLYHIMGACSELIGSVRS